MNNVVNNKRVFWVSPHRPVGFVEILGKRDDVRLDMLENDNPPETASPVLAAAHAYQTSSTRQELARHYHTSADFLRHTPNLLVVSTNGAGYDTVDVQACTERGSSGRQSVRRQRRVGCRACRRHDADAGQARRRMRPRVARRHAGDTRRLYGTRGARQVDRHHRSWQCRTAGRRTLRHALSACRCLPMTLI